MLRLLAMIRRHRYVLRNFISRDVKLKYRGTGLGYLWSLLEPISMVLVYFFVFEVIMRRGGHGYPLVIFLGLLPYGLLTTILQGGAQALVNDAALIRRVQLPREVFVLGNTGSAIVIFHLNLLAVLPFLLLFSVVPSLDALWLLPLGTALIVMFGLGIAMVAACLNAMYRDVGYVIQVALRILFYISPIIYPVSYVPERLRGLYLLNPISVYITLIRNSVMGQPLPFGAAHIGFAIGCAALSFILGVGLFRRLERQAVKFL